EEEGRHPADGLPGVGPLQSESLGSGLCRRDRSEGADPDGRDVVRLPGRDVRELLRAELLHQRPHGLQVRGRDLSQRGHHHPRRRPGEDAEGDRLPLQGGDLGRERRRREEDGGLGRSRRGGGSEMTDTLRPMTEIQIEQTREFVDSLNAKSQTYWDMVTVGDELWRDLHITPELVILYADGVEDYNPWYEGWLMNTWYVDGESPFGGAIVPPMLVSHFVLSVQFDHTKPFAIGSLHTFHDSEIIEPIPVGATVRIHTKA